MVLLVLAAVIVGGQSVFEVSRSFRWATVAMGCLLASRASWLRNNRKSALGSGLLALLSCAIALLYQKGWLRIPTVSSRCVCVRSCSRSEICRQRECSEKVKDETCIANH